MRQRDAFANGNFSQTVKVRLYDNVRDGSGLLAAWKVPRLFFGEQLDGLVLRDHPNNLLHGVLLEGERRGHQVLLPGLHPQDGSLDRP